MYCRNQVPTLKLICQIKESQSSMFRTHCQHLQTNMLHLTQSECNGLQWFRSISNKIYNTGFLQTQIWFWRKLKISTPPEEKTSQQVSISKYPAAYDKLFISAQKYNIVHSLDLESHLMWSSSRNNVNHPKHTEFSVQPCTKDKTVVTLCSRFHLLWAPKPLLEHEDVFIDTSTIDLLNILKIFNFKSIHIKYWNIFNTFYDR